MVALNILVFVPLFAVATAQMYGYPAPYPYPQQYPSYGGDVNNFGGQGYPQVYPQNYPYPYQPINPYAPQYPSYPTFQSYPPVSYPGSVPQGYPDQQYPGSGMQPQYPPGTYPGSVPQGYPDQQYPGMQPQFPPGTNVYPANYPLPTPQSIQTPYGNIPVEIIDVDEDVERQMTMNGTGVEEQLTPILTESKSNMDVLPYPTKNTRFQKTDPSQTKIVRTLDPKGNKIHVEIQTNSPPVKDKDTNSEENKIEETETTTKAWLFG